MIPLVNGERVIETFDVKKSKVGPGQIYVTNLGMAFESVKKDTLHISWEEMTNYSAKKKDTVLVSWDAINSESGALQRWSFEFKVSSAEQVTHSIQLANEEYANSAPAEQLLSSFRQEDNTNHVNSEGVVDAVPSEILQKIPEYVKPDQIWNDCYFDEEKNLYVTFTKWALNELSRDGPTQQKFDQEHPNHGGILIHPNDVTLVCGFPAVRAERGYAILASLKESDLTEEIVKRRIYPHIDDDLLLEYSVLAPIYHKMSGRFGEGLTLREYELGKDLHCYVYMNPKVIKIWEKQLKNIPLTEEENNFAKGELAKIEPQAS